MKVKETINRKAVGKELRKVRESLGIRQSFIAEKLHINSDQLCRLEKGDFGPWSLGLIVRWRAALGLPVQHTNGTRSKPRRNKRK